ncbi:hypothetical protein INT43_000860 [Umbelopsis isabellina]|uniref:Uncharacterized protein n=1 Tax=Mortierella isabellina TaxID=91625 RepID=A0A8H7Q2J4_MORIS|nr:hypothetical protein INT43_000860 [Umbelopsis isabellina]
MEINPDSAAHALTEGLSQQLLPSLDALEKKLSWFESRQSELLSSLQKANDSSLTELDLNNVKETMQKASTYRDKLQSMTSTMKSLDVRSRQLKDRVSQLHKARIHYDAQAMNARKKNQEHDKAVAAKMAASVDSPSATPPTPQAVSNQSSPVHPSSRSSSPFIDTADQPSISTPRTEYSSLSESISTGTVSVIKKKKKAKPKKREAVIDEGPINLKRTIPPKLPGRSPK